MGVFDKAIRSAKGIGNSAINSVSNLGTSLQDNSELTRLKMQVKTIEQELDASYVIIGRKYVDYIVKNGEMGPLDVSDTLRFMNPKFTMKQELEVQIAELEKKIKDNSVLREKQMAEQEYLAIKSKLDKALQMDIISQEEYDAKLDTALKKYSNFKEIRSIEAQYDMGIITREEKDDKLAKLME